jgi:glycosyltransferase involved in cell wall biosynthesis
MKRTILSVAYPFTEVGTDAVGGSEQILTMLDSALTEAGHQSIVIAAEGSKIAGILIPSPAAGRHLNERVRESGRRVHRQLIEDALAKYDVDLVHMHSLDFHHYLPASRVPILATLHLPPDWYPRQLFRMKRRNFWMNCVSASQHKTCPPSASMLRPIPNGVDVHRLACDVPRRKFALALGRICPEKGFHFALEASRKAGIKLLLAGQVFPMNAHMKYFKKEILPRLDSARKFTGPLGFSKKRRLLSQAKCVIIPSLVAETSSLVAMEALACGTPVIAFRAGALPEIVEHGRTGFIVSNVKQMSAALLRVDTIKAEACRQAARTRFSAEVMSAKYLALYQRLIEKAEGESARIRGRTWTRRPIQIGVGARQCLANL